MKVFILSTPLIFSCIPRVYPKINDTLVLELRNEMTSVVLTPDISFTLTDKLNITIIVKPDDFKTQNKYELTIKNSGSVIYRGKGIVLDNNTNVQNYQYGTQTNKIFDFK